MNDSRSQHRQKLLEPFDVRRPRGRGDDVPVGDRFFELRRAGTPQSYKKLGDGVGVPALVGSFSLIKKPTEVGTLNTVNPGL